MREKMRKMIKIKEYTFYSYSDLFLSANILLTATIKSILETNDEKNLVKELSIINRNLLKASKEELADSLEIVNFRGEMRKLLLAVTELKKVKENIVVLDREIQINEDTVLEVGDRVQIVKEYNSEQKAALRDLTNSLSFSMNNTQYLKGIKSILTLLKMIRKDINKKSRNFFPSNRKEKEDNFKISRLAKAINEDLEDIYKKEKSFLVNNHYSSSYKKEVKEIYNLCDFWEDDLDL